MNIPKQTKSQWFDAVLPAIRVVVADEYDLDCSGAELIVTAKDDTKQAALDAALAPFA